MKICSSPKIIVFTFRTKIFKNINFIMIMFQRQQPS